MDDMEWTLLATAFGCDGRGIYVPSTDHADRRGRRVSPIGPGGHIVGKWLAGFSIDNLSLMALAIPWASWSTTPSS